MKHVRVHGQFDHLNGAEYRWVLENVIDYYKLNIMVTLIIATIADISLLEQIITAPDTW